MSADKLQLARLSPDGNRYVGTLRRNQFKLFEWGTVQHTHVDKSETYTRLEWASLPDKTQYVVLGCKSGAVQVWDVTGAVSLVRQIDHFAGSGRQITNIWVNALRKSVFLTAAAAAGDASGGEIVEVSLVDGAVTQKFARPDKKSETLAIAASGETLVAVAARKMKAFNIANGQSVGKFSCPINACSSVAICENYILAADSSDSITVRKVGEEKFSATLSAGQPVFLSNVKLTKQGKAFRATAFTQDGLKMFVWTFKSLETNKPKAADHVVETSDGNKVLAFVEGADNRYTVATGVVQMPNIEQVQLDKKKISLSGGAAAGAQDGKAGKKRKADDVAEGPAAKKQKLVEQHKAKQGPMVVSAMQTRVSKPSMPSFLEGELGEAAQKEYKELQAKIWELGKEDGDFKEKGRSASKHLANVNGWSSLAPILKQYLKSREEKLLHELCQVVDRKVVEATVMDLSGMEAFAWLQECGLLLQKHPSKAKHLSEWMKHVLVHHCSFFMAHQSLRAELQPLHKALDDRVQSHQSLLRLSGKLDMLLASVNKGSKSLTDKRATDRKMKAKENAGKVAGKKAGGEDNTKEPLVTFKDGEAEDDDEDDEEEDSDDDDEISPEDIMADMEDAHLEDLLID